MSLDLLVRQPQVTSGLTNPPTNVNWAVIALSFQGLLTSKEPSMGWALIGADIALVLRHKNMFLFTKAQIWGDWGKGDIVIFAHEPGHSDIYQMSE